MNARECVGVWVSNPHVDGTKLRIEVRRGRGRGTED